MDILFVSLFLLLVHVKYSCKTDFVPSPCLCPPLCGHSSVFAPVFCQIDRSMRQSWQGHGHCSVVKQSLCLHVQSTPATLLIPLENCSEHLCFGLHGRAKG